MPTWAALPLGLLVLLLAVSLFAGEALLRAKGQTKLPFWDWRTYALLASRAWHEPRLRQLVRVVLSGPRRGLGMLDAGAWVGDLCIGCAEEFPESAVVAIEPSRGLADFVQTTAKQNGLGNLSVRHAALSDEEGVPVATDKGSAPDASYTKTSREASTAETVTLDGLRSRAELPRLGLLHLDVEGSELAAVRGALRCIQADRPFVLVETLRDRTAIGHIQALLQPLGYSSGSDVDEVCVFGDWGDKRGCRNILFAPNEDSDVTLSLRHLLTVP
jgi:FkbM family methyltransferase